MEDIASWISILGNLGEFIGSVAVLVTLVYLALQVRQSRAMLEENRKIALAQTYQARAQMAAGIVNYNPLELTPRLQKMSFFDLTVEDLKDFDDAEKAFLRQALTQLMLGMDNVFYQDRLGLVDNDMPEGGKALLRKLAPVMEELGVNFLPEARKAMDEGNAT